MNILKGLDHELTFNGYLDVNDRMCEILLKYSIPKKIAIKTIYTFYNIRKRKLLRNVWTRLNGFNIPILTNKRILNKNEEEELSRDVHLADSKKDCLSKDEVIEKVS